MSERSISPPPPPLPHPSTASRLSPIDHSSHRRSLSPRSPPSRRGRSYSRSRSSSSRSYSRSRSRSRSYSRHRRSSPSRSRSPYHRRRSDSRGGYHRTRYYSRSPPPLHRSSRRSPPPPPPSRRYRSRSPPLPPPRRRLVNKDCRVYVGNLHFEVTWHQLKDFMREAGQVVHVDVLKLPNGRSKGCGVVEYRHPEEAKRAIHIMNKVEFMGRPVFVREDREYENAGPPRDPRDAPENCRLHVSNLPYNASWQDMKDLFRKAGRVLHTDIHTDEGSRRPNGNGTVIVDDPRTARAAIELLDGYEWQGRRIEVREGRHPDRLSSSATAAAAAATAGARPVKSLDYGPPPPALSRLPHPTSADASYKAESSINSAYHSSSIPPPNSSVPPQHISSSIPPPISMSTMTAVPEAVDPYQNAYRYGGAEPLPPPPPPNYTHMTLVGGPAANLPTHGHNQIFVNNLPFSTTWQDLIDLFRHVGPVVRSEILTVNGHPKGSGFVRFEDSATCERAIEKFHGYMYGGRHLDIRLDKYSTTI